MRRSSTAGWRHCAGSAAVIVALALTACAGERTGVSETSVVDQEAGSLATSTLDTGASVPTTLVDPPRSGAIGDPRTTAPSPGASTLAELTLGAASPQAIGSTDPTDPTDPTTPVTRATAPPSTLIEPSPPPGRLVDRCPDPVVVRTGWFPRAEDGYLYALLGPDQFVDSAGRSVTASLIDPDTGSGAGVRITIVAPPRTAAEPPPGLTASLAALRDDDVHLAVTGSTEDQLVAWRELRTTQVFAPLERSPLAIVWDPARFARADEISDFRRGTVRILHSSGSMYMAYLLATEQVVREQLDGSFTGSFGPFVRGAGRYATQARVTSDVPYLEAELAAWRRPLRFSLLHDAGWRPYDAPLVIRSDRQDDLAQCLEELVPMMQRAQTNYVAAPQVVNGRIATLSEIYGVSTTVRRADDAALAMRVFGLVGNGDDVTIGDPDLTRLAQFTNQVRSLLAGTAAPLPGSLSVEELATRRFTRPGVGLRRP